MSDSTEGRPSPSSLAGTRVLIAGGAGFLGSHLTRRCLAAGAEVVVIDNFVTGARENLEEVIGDPGFTFLHSDVSNFVHVPGHLDHILHFASPASPIDYLQLPIQTLKVGSLGTHNLLGLAKEKRARLLLASTSEVYGDPQVHPQPETYWGHVNPIGPRGVYDEAKRFAEAMTYAYHREHDVEVRVARIFNTYGPGMRAADGRAIPTFLSQALTDQPITVHGDGSQTRSLCYVDDLVEGLLRLLVSDYTQPVNIGNPTEYTILELAETIVELTGSSSTITTVPRPKDDPQVRRPDTTVAERELGWRAQVALRDGLVPTIEAFRQLDVARAVAHVRENLPGDDGMATRHQGYVAPTEDTA